jgi:diadenosine tetraphosphatase ApaH/serine/threonine PP2A family protein phosphatase
VAAPDLHQEPNILKIKQEKDQLVHVVGDLHGTFTEGVARYFQQQGFPGEKNKFNKNKINVYVFNGDFVDRGAEDIEVMATLLFWKIIKPEHVFLIRGNHETKQTSTDYRFQARVDARFPEWTFQGKNNAHTEFVDKAFSKMPVGAVLDDTVFIVHGGIGEDPDGTAWTIEDLNKEDRFQADLWPEDNWRLSMLIWSDPNLNTGPGERGVGGNFGPETTNRFLAKNNLKLIVRAHQHLSNVHSMQSHHDQRVYTIHSAADYDASPSNASYWTFSKDKFGPEELQLPEKFKIKSPGRTFSGPLALNSRKVQAAKLHKDEYTSELLPTIDFVAPETMTKDYRVTDPKLLFRGPFSYAKYIRICDEKLGLAAGKYFADILPGVQQQLLKDDPKQQSGLKDSGVFPSLFVRATLNRPLWSRYNPDPEYFFNNSGHADPERFDKNIFETANDIFETRQ